MANNFNGFSPEDIKKMTSSKPRKVFASEGRKPTIFKGHGILRMPEKVELSKSTENLKKKNIVQTSASTENSMMEEVNLDKSMSKSIEEALFYQPLPKINSQVTGPIASQAEHKRCSLSPVIPCADESSILKIPDHCNVSSASSSSSILFNHQQMPPNIESPFKGISLKDFESHRKIIEEQNKQKKDMLYKAIEHHSQKTAAEARKIEEIKVELAKLDSDLATDVGFLRQQIDNACITYAAIEKQYIKIEAQFLKAKIDLHNASEKKDLLTEHLCTVIAHNEDRKAQKLSELMEKVGLTPSGDSESFPANGLSTPSI